MPALGPTSLDVISSSLQHSTGANKAFSAGRQAARLPARTGQPSSVNNRKAGENAVRLLGSSHIGVDSQPLRAEPSAQHSSSSEDLYLHKNQSDSSLSSLGGILPRARSVTQSSSATSTAVSATSRNLRKFVHAEKDGHDTMYDTTVPDATGNEEGQTILKGLPVSRITQPTLPPPRRQSNSLTQPESSTSRASKILFGSTPLTGHPGPYSATNVRSSPTKQRTNSLPHISHSRAVSVAGSTASQPSLGPRHLHKGPQGLTRAASVSYKHMQLDTLFLKGRDASQEWLDKARAGRQGAQREERQGLITADEVAITAEVADEDGHESDISDSGNVGSISRQDRWGELERKRTEEEAGWTRLD